MDQKGPTGPERDKDPNDGVLERLADLARESDTLALPWPFADDPATDPYLNQA